MTTRVERAVRLSGVLMLWPRVFDRFTPRMPFRPWTDLFDVV